MTTKWRPGPNGTLMAPTRGEPPPLPEGYVYQRGNRYVALPILPECKYRVYKKFEKPCCGGKAGETRCTFYNKVVISPECLKCGGKK